MSSLEDCVEKELDLGEARSVRKGRDGGAEKIKGDL